MTRSTDSQRIDKLKELIEDYRYHYHVLDESIMSEAAMDSLKHELSQLEAKHPDLITPDSPSQRVAGTVMSGFEKVRHSSRMLSLNDVFDQEEVEAWAARIAKQLSNENQQIEYFVDIKMDGLACALIYQDGQLMRGVTRGDGFEGEDVTTNIRTIESIPLNLRNSPNYQKFLSGRTEVRGEIVMYLKDFKALNKQRENTGKPLFANARNTAAGTIRQLDPRLVAERKLHFRAYDLRRDDASEVPSNDFAYKAINELGLLVNQDSQVFRTVSDVMGYIKLWENKRQELPFGTDGVVIKVNQRDIYRRLGVAGKAPRAAVAYKFAAEQATTKVKDIFVSIGRTGAATPVAVLEPVSVAGSTVQMATLHNESEVIRKDIRVGDTVIIHKAGDIIPEIVEPIASLRDGSEKVYKLPSNCPECNTKLVKLNVDDAVWRCPNDRCPSRTWKRIEHFASKSALDIEGLGEKNVIALLTAELIKDQADIYTLTPEMLLGLDRFAELSARKLVAAVQAKKQPSLGRFIYGLGIRHVGVQTAIDISEEFRSIEAISEASITDLCRVQGVGEIVAESVVEWFSEPQNQKLINKFGSLDVKPQGIKKRGGKLSGQSLVVTGTLKSMSREDAADKIRGLGGTFQSSVGKDTNYLVVGGSVGSSKLKLAEKYGTNILTEDKFLELIDFS